LSRRRYALTRGAQSRTPHPALSPKGRGFLVGRLVSRMAGLCTCWQRRFRKSMCRVSSSRKAAAFCSQGRSPWKPRFHFDVVSPNGATLFRPVGALLPRYVPQFQGLRPWLQSFAACAARQNGGRSRILINLHLEEGRGFPTGWRWVSNFETIPPRAHSSGSPVRSSEIRRLKSGCMSIRAPWGRWHGTGGLPHKKWALVCDSIGISGLAIATIFVVCGGDEAPLPRAPSTLFSVAAGSCVVDLGGLASLARSFR